MNTTQNGKKLVTSALGAAVAAAAVPAVLFLGAGASQAEPDTCVQGYVWREAQPSDHVCVDPSVRSSTAQENQLAADRRDPTGGPYGPDTCKQGYVWREAFDGDHVCVIPSSRTQAANDNAAAASRLAVDTPMPTTLDVNFAPIVFATGIPVGGWAHLTLRQDGTYTFSGHFHDSGADEFNTQLVWVVKDAKNIVYTFQHAGHVAGTFESGSRDDDWTVDSRNDRIAANWADIASSPFNQASAHVGADLTNVTNSLIGAAGTVLGVVAIVAA